MSLLQQVRKMFKYLIFSHDAIQQRDTHIFCIFQNWSIFAFNFLVHIETICHVWQFQHATCEGIANSQICLVNSVMRYKEIDILSIFQNLDIVHRIGQSYITIYTIKLLENRFNSSNIQGYKDIQRKHFTSHKIRVTFLFPIISLVVGP